MTEKKERDSREIVLDMLIEILEQKKFSHIVLRETLSHYKKKEKRERAFITRLTEGTVEKVILLDYVIDCFASMPVRKMKSPVRNLLRMSAYQILFMEIPDAAACNEAVKIAVRRGFSGLKGFVNGILRTVAREKDDIRLPQGECGLSVRYSVPLWLVRHLTVSYGEQKAKEILAELSGEQKEVCVRVHLSRYTEEEILAALHEDGVSARKHPYGAGAFLLESPERLTDLRAFRVGMFHVQDYVSLMPGESVKDYLRPGMTVIDVCAAPGGKSLHIADLLNGTGHVISRDISEKKIEKIRENRIQSGFSNITEEVRDAAVPDEASVEKADIVLADLPCSGLGILAKKPDIKYNMTKEAMASLAELQRQILSVVWRYVKPGGFLVYSTCTMNPEENEHNTAWFLQQFPFQKESERQYFPQRGLCDGFYVAVLKRNA